MAVAPRGPDSASFRENQLNEGQLKVDRHTLHPTPSANHENTAFALAEPLRKREVPVDQFFRPHVF